MGVGGGVTWWYWTTLSVFRVKKPPGIIIGLTDVSERFLNVNKEQKNCTPTLLCKVQLFHYTMGQWVMDSDL